MEEVVPVTNSYQRLPSRWLRDEATGLVTNKVYADGKGHKRATRVRPQWWGSGGGVAGNYGIMCAMRPLRNFKTHQCCHLISRIANRAFFLNDEEKSRFVERLWRVAAFSCVEVLAYCFMSNHFHILVYVPDRRELSDDELLARIRALYSGTALAEIEKEWEQLKKVGGESGRERFRKRHLRRMWSASEFMKTLKQTATMSYNGRRVHTGTIWESRFRVKTCEPDEKTTPLAKAGYIAVEGGEKNRYSPDKRYKLLRKGKAVVRA